jgi:hypothetical protein
MDFETLWAGATEAQLSRTRIRVAALEHLIQMKQSVGRPQDLADVEALMETQRLLADSSDGRDPNGATGP